MSEPRKRIEWKHMLGPSSLMGAICVLLAFLIAGAFFAVGHYCANCDDPRSCGGSTEMGAEAFVAEITDFYELIITILFAVIGIVLGVAVVYVRTVSKLQASDMATEALETSSFKAILQHKVDEVKKELEQSARDQWIDFKNSDEIEEIRASQGDLRKSVKKLLERVRYVEEVMNVYTSADDKTGLTLEEPPAADGD
ncbi:MAG TPA: hypothetical protein VMY42_22820 [Thermoguttaceae bacterium]|nr:hypothetical protein [Thermoguttaceae bacterium]